MKIKLFCLIVSLFFVSTVANAQVKVSAGSNLFTTLPTTTKGISLPANFFPGSLPFSKTVNLTSNPSPGNQYDTVITRNTDVVLPGTTTLTIRALDMKSVNPIDVSFSDGHTERYNITTSLSTAQASTGTMTLSGTASGGQLKLNATIFSVFKFFQVSPLTGVANIKPSKVFDLGDPFVQLYLKNAVAKAQSNIENGLGTDADKALVEEFGSDALEPVGTKITATSAFKLTGTVLTIPGPVKGAGGTGTSHNVAPVVPLG